MNFDLGDILTRAGQITWRNKVLWLFSALPTLLNFLIFPIFFLPVFLTDFDPYSEPFFVDQPVYVFLFVGLSLFISLLSFVLYAISSASVTTGAVQAESGAEKLELTKLFDDGRKYWLRMMGMLLLIGVAASVGITVIFGGFILIGAVTMGLGFICLQPLFLLMYPLMLVLYSIIEVSQVAVVADDLGVTDAIRRGWELVKANFWRIVLISLIVYLGVAILTFIVTIPFMIPFFFMPFFMQDMSSVDPRTMMLITGGFTLLFLPVMALVQGVTITLLKTTYTLIYLRLTRRQGEAPAILDANA